MPDDELRKMERYLSEIFSQAEKDLIQKSLKYMADFERKDKAKLKKVENGEITDDEYKEWRKNQLLYGEHWTRLIQLVQKEMVNVNQTALDYINDKTTQIYADSYNSIATVIKQSPVEGYSFELVDANTIKNLAKEEGIILPPKKNLDVQKDKLWNAKQVNAQLLQGILQGEDIPHIAGRMAKVCESNKSASIRNARTMVTAAENSGRQSGMNKAESDGIIFKKMWIATRDERTRESHMVLNGKLVANGEKFVTINGDEIEFPGDWRAKASEVYNCRCTLGTIVTGFKKAKLEEAIEKQEALEQQVKAEESVDNLQYVSDINDIREKFNQTTEPEERDKLILEAGTVMGTRHKEYYERIDDFDSRIKDIANQYNDELKGLRQEYDRLRKEVMHLIKESMEKTVFGTPERAEVDAKIEETTQMREKAWEKYNELAFRIGKMQDKLRSEKREAVNKMLEFRKEMLKEIRECGTGTHKRTEFFTGTKAVQEVLFDCLADYPKEWVDAMREAGKLNCAEVNRGYYNHYQKKIRIDSGGKETAYHEEGHVFEKNIPNILEAEKQFYERRTAGEELEWMGPGYGKDEKTRKDNFMSWYMGKDYGGRAYELVSMGFESYFTNSYYLKEDEDFSNFIMGVLALC